MSRRIRRSPDASRNAALDAAHAILVEHGPAAVTLQAVAAASGTTHGNLTHHFGSVGGLHAALIRRVADALARRATEAAPALRRGDIPAEDIVDMVFAAIGQGGIGRLIGWLAANGRTGSLAPIHTAIGQAVHILRADEPPGSDAETEGAGPIVLGLMAHALTASLVGVELEAAVGMREGGLRRLASDQLRRLRAAGRTL